MKNIRRWIWIILLIETALVGVILLTARVTLMTLNTGEVETYGEGWTLTYEDRSVVEIERLPWLGSSKAGETLVLENTLPSEYAGKTLSFLSADKTLRIYVDELLIYHFGDEDKYLFGHTPGSVMVFADLPEQLQGKRIRIEMCSPYADYASYLKEISVGDRDVLILRFISHKAFDLLCTGVIILVGLILLILAFFQRKTNHAIGGNEYLAVYFLLVGMYHLVETKVLTVFYGNQYLYSNLVFLILMIAPLFLEVYFTEILPEGERILQVLMWLSIANIALQLLLQLTNTVDFLSMAILSHGILFIMMVIVGGLMIRSVWNKRGVSMPIRFFGMSCALIGSTVDLLRTYVQKVGDLGQFSRYGMTVFALCTMGVYLRSMIREQIELAEQARDSADAANRAKSDFLANMSHEIRTPINGILGMDAMLMRDCTDEKQLGYARNIESSAKTLLSLVNDILAVAKMDSGQELDLGGFSRKIRRYEEQIPIQLLRFRAPDARILAVDDVSMNLKVLTGLLKDTEIRIDTAKSGQDALSLLKERRYDLIFLDHMMPGMDGVETLQKLRRTKGPNQYTPVIVVTANALDGAKEEFLAQGFEDYISKPVREETLLTLTAKYLPEELMQRQMDEPDTRRKTLSESREEAQAKARAGEQRPAPQETPVKSSHWGKRLFLTRYRRQIEFALLALALDVAGWELARFLELPVRLDSIGTVLAALGFGPLGGVAVGVAGSLIYGMGRTELISCLLVSAVVGALVGWIRPRVNTDALQKVIVGILAALTAVVAAVPMNLYFRGGYVDNLWGDALYEMMVDGGSSSTIAAILAEGFVELPDKLLAVFTAAWLLGLLRRRMDRGGEEQV